jgi:putative phosphoserine phosphatase/1-acylglycerol-3-phosphate O-acyltransferase
VRDLQLLLQHLFHPGWQRWVRFDIAGIEHIPATGAAIIALNHRSYADFFVLAQLVRRSGRPLRMMAKKELFDAPVVGRVCHGMGGIPVDRSASGTAPYAAAIAELDRGELVGMMPQGTIPRGAAFFDPVLRGKTGVARLARAAGVPVIPVGIWGTEVLWPRSAKGPRVSRWRAPVPVRVRIGPPVELGEPPHAFRDTARIMAAITDLLPPEARVAHTPTEAELRSADPNGDLPAT